MAGLLQRMARPLCKQFLQSGSFSLRQRIWLRSLPSGQEGDPRSPILIIETTSGHLQNQDYELPFDCQAILFPPPTDILSIGDDSRLGDRFGILVVILLRLDVGMHIFRRHQSDGVFLSCQPPAEVMCTTARFHGGHTR
jgi:hypothetical protein